MTREGLRAPGLQPFSMTWQIAFAIFFAVSSERRPRSRFVMTEALFIWLSQKNSSFGSFFKKRAAV